MLDFLSGPQFVYTTVPVRITMGIIANAVWIYLPSRAGPGLAIVAIYDLFGAILLGWALGSFTGRMPTPPLKTKKH